MRLHAGLVELPLRTPLHIGEFRMRAVQTVITALVDDCSGAIGLGEASVNLAWTASAQEALSELQWATRWPDTLPDDTGDPRWADALAPLSHPARSGVVSAALDLSGKLTDRPVWRMWGLRPGPCPATSVTLSQRDPAALADELALLADTGTSLVKVKASPFMGHEAQRRWLETIRSALPGARMRLDMNCSWSLREFSEAVDYLAELDVEQVEEPLSLDEPLETYERFHGVVPFDLVADERTLRHRLDQLPGRFHYVNLKQAYLGGLCGVRRAVEHARRCGLRVMLGCNGESNVGISAMAQLASLVDRLDLDSALLLADDPFLGVGWDQGKPVLREVPGTGVRPVHADRLPEPLSTLLRGME